MATPLPDPKLVIIYVSNVSNSREFYTRLFQKEPVEASSCFAMYALTSGMMFGIWNRSEVLPPVTAQPGASEHCIALADISAVRAVHDELKGRGVKVLQAPTQMDFGFTFVAGDPDGHRLRFFVPTES
jgi:predicted enzyme related to lactoylglutathione lyase